MPPKFVNGTPPHAGWFLTRKEIPLAFTGNMWRWWDGQHWSVPAPSFVTAEAAAAFAAVKDTRYPEFIVYSMFYPVGARVERTLTVENNEEFYPVMQGGVHTCCNCGLSHKVDYKVYYKDIANKRLVGLKPDTLQIGVTVCRI
jgi:hypothetical protein